MREQAVGGAVAIVVGAFVYNSPGTELDSYETSFMNTTVQHSQIAVTRSSFTNCSAVSFSGGPTSSSFGTASVYGGALSVLHSPQVSTFPGINLLLPPPALRLAGLNLTFFILSSNFTACYAVTNSTSVLPGTANGGGGAVYASSVAFAKVSVQSSSFNSCSVTVAIGASRVASNSSGGGLSVEIPCSNSCFASVLLSSNTFWNCSANGAGQSYPFMAVRGGGVAVSRAAVIRVVNTSFSACSVAVASSVSVVSGGAGLSVILVSSSSLMGCSFDGSGGQDSSGTSAGLLVLSSNAAPNQLAIDGCSFSSTGNASLNVACVDADTGFNSVPCVKPGIAVSVANSNISQLAPAVDGSDFSSIGSVLISLHQNVNSTFSNSFVVCNSSQFAIFRKLLFNNVVYQCSPCLNFQFSRTSSISLLDSVSTAPSIDKCVSSSSNAAALSCPFGVDICSTILSVASGFWTNFTKAGDELNGVSRCPEGYCGCGSEFTSCLLYPPLSPDYHPDDALCNGNRRGVLCGGCKTNFTQSLDGVTCISNEECGKNVGWTWAVTIIGYTMYAMYTVITSLQESDGLITCVLFYGQMSLFASYRRLVKGSSDASLSSSATSSWFARITQFESVASLYSGTCYGRDMSAYTFTATQLSGPAIMFVLSVTIVMVLKKAQPIMQRHDIDVRVSVSAALFVVSLMLFSSVTTIIFKLITCKDDLNVIFIDGTEPCRDAKWQGLVFVVIILCISPILFAAALRSKRLPQKIRTAVCSAYLESKHYWSAVTLAFRLVMSVVYATFREFPSIAALVQSILCVAMLLLLTYQRPYRLSSTFHFDVLCHVCLIIQFVLEVVARSTESLGISLGPNNRYYQSVQSSYEASFYLRCVIPQLLLSGALTSKSHATRQVSSVCGWRCSLDVSQTRSSRPKNVLCVSLL